MKSYVVDFEGRRIVAEACSRADGFVSVYSIRPWGSRDIETHVDKDPNGTQDHVEAFSAWSLERRIALMHAVGRAMRIGSSL